MKEWKNERKKETEIKKTERMKEWKNEGRNERKKERKKERIASSLMYINHVSCNSYLHCDKYIVFWFYLVFPSEIQDIIVVSSSMWSTESVLFS